MATDNSQARNEKECLDNTHINVKTGLGSLDKFKRSDFTFLLKNRGPACKLAGESVIY
jgi:hypothetical protein